MTANFTCTSFSDPGRRFGGASFLGDVYFGDTFFTAGHADFKGMTFHGDVRFGCVSLQPEGLDP